MPHVDIHQLPMPNWFLSCPACEYVLNGVSEHRCPECGITFKIEDVVQSWHRLREPVFDGSESPLPDFGLMCALCEKPLVGSRNQQCIHCDNKLRMELQDIPPDRWICLSPRFTAGMDDTLVEMIFQHDYIPYLLESGKQFSEAFLGARPIPRRAYIDRDFIFDALYAIHREYNRLVAHGRYEWNCKQCNEENPHTFETCWQCGLTR